MKGIKMPMNESIRVQRQDGSWLPLDCTATDQTGLSATIKIPAWKATWIIAPTGMVANIGGNDWRIYTVHPDDAIRLCGSLPAPAPSAARLEDRPIARQTCPLPEARCVLASGPEDDGDGNPEYCVCFGDDDGEPITRDKRYIWLLWEHEAARTHAAQLAQRYHLELVDECSAP